MNTPLPIYSTAATGADILRALANLLLAPAMWILSSIGFILPNVRTAGEFSDMSDNLLVPLGPAFSIWFPIFVGCIAYGIVQFRKANRTRAVYRAVGGWTALGFALICGWALITAFAPSAYVQWGTALVFVPAVLALVMAVIRFARHINAVSGLERLMTWVPISLIAGWCSLAVFLNWTPIAYDTFSDGQADVTGSLLILSLALGFIIAVCRLSLCNKVYVVPAIWGLAWLVVRHLGGESGTPIIGWVSAAGILLLLASALLHPRVPIAGYAEKTSA